MKTTRNLLMLVAVLFGLATIFAGSRVLLGADPGYIVCRPLLVFNTIMGVLYILAGIAALRSGKQALYAAAVIFTLNLIVLSFIYYLHTKGGPVALDSLRAMMLRTTVWLALFAGFGWLSYRNKKV